MFSFKKFFEPDAPETPSTTSSPMSIVEAMARHGVMNTSDNPVAEPIIINSEKKEEPTTATTPDTVETTTLAPNAETVTPETPLPETVSKEAATTPQIEEAAPVQATWQEVLRQQQPDTVLKEVLGVDDRTVDLLKTAKQDEKMLAFLEHWKNNGDVKSYLQELSTDYTKMPAEEVLRQQLRRDYPKANEAQLNVLYKQEIKQFNLESEDPDEAQEGRLLLEAKTDRFRDELIANQAKFLLPKPPEAKPVESQVDTQAQAAQQEFEAYQADFNSHPYTKDVFTNRRVSFGEGDEKFSFNIDPEQTKGVLFDTNKWADNMFIRQPQPDGTIKLVPDVEKQILVSLVATNGKQFLTEYAKHFKAIGGKSVVAPIENAKPPESSTAAKAEATPQNAAEAMAKQGRLVSGGY